MTRIHSRLSAKEKERQRVLNFTFTYTLYQGGKHLFLIIFSPTMLHFFPILESIGTSHCSLSIQGAAGHLFQTKSSNVSQAIRWPAKRMHNSLKASTFKTRYEIFDNSVL